MYRLDLDEARMAALRAAMHAYDAALLDAIGKMRHAGMPDAAAAIANGPPRQGLLDLMAAVETAGMAADGYEGRYMAGLEDDAEGCPVEGCQGCGRPLTMPNVNTKYGLCPACAADQLG